MNNVLSIHNCYGCGVCAASCSKKIIKIRLNRDGFYEPYIEHLEKCSDCGLCLDVCAYNHKERSLQNVTIKAWAAWSKDDRVRKKSSSGGIGFEIGKQLIERGYLAVGCRYNVEHQRAEHFIASTVEEFIQSIGSKYIQSYTEEAFKQIDRKRKYLITGTPCQIDSFRRMIRKFRCEDNFVLMDFYCHCVPSMHAWTAYRKMLEPKIGEVTYASWRNKFSFGWHDSWIMGIDGSEEQVEPIDWHESYNMLIRGKKTYVCSRMSKGDMFYKLFLGDICLGPQCQNACKYKWDKSSADIRIGDLWGKTYEKDEKGVSALVSFTEKGRNIIESLNNVSLIEHPFDIVAEGQMKTNAKQRELTPIFRYMLRNGWKLDGVTFRTLYFMQRVIGKLIRVL